uniref:signal peptidase II n=1 Tax=Streptococcus suis TaxID=1307 RepID=UPI00187391A8
MRKIVFPLWIAALIGLDQLVKWWTVETIALHEVKPFLPNIMSLTYLRNYGAAYSILQNQQWLFTIVTLVVMSALTWYFVKNINGSI